MMHYTLVTQQWVPTRPVSVGECDVGSVFIPSTTQYTATAAPTCSVYAASNAAPRRNIRMFSCVTSIKIEAQRIRARLTLADLAARVGITLGALNEILAKECVVSPAIAKRLNVVFNQDMLLYPAFRSSRATL